jgi:hypothetical protein
MNRFGFYYPILFLNLWAIGCTGDTGIRSSDSDILICIPDKSIRKAIIDKPDHLVTAPVLIGNGLSKLAPETALLKGGEPIPLLDDMNDYNDTNGTYKIADGSTRFRKSDFLPEKTMFFTADNPNIQYTGRIDFSDPRKPKFWSPGVYIKAKYHGSSCIIAINDQLLWGTSKNYLEIVIDDTLEYRVQTTGPINEIKVGEGLNIGDHTILICKDSEAGIGYLEFLGLRCDSLLPLPPKPVRKIEFIGNSITCGSGIDTERIPCDAGVWYDQHNAYRSYGPITARNLNAQWHITAVSGIGLIHSCCNMNITMPEVFDIMNIRDNKGTWNFSNYVPDVVTICLGQNDGIQDSGAFCDVYVSFIHTIRQYYPHAKIVCLTSPMADTLLSGYLKKCLTGIVYKINSEGDPEVYKYFFSRSFNSGCGTHPGMADHVAIAEELTGFLKSITGW